MWEEPQSNSCIKNGHCHSFRNIVRDNLTTMKFFSTLLSIILVSVLLSSCSSSNDVASNGILVKRKHRTGLHLNIRHKEHQQEAKLADASATIRLKERLFSLAPSEAESVKALPSENAERTLRTTTRAEVSQETPQHSARTHIQLSEGMEAMEDAQPQEAEGKKFNKASKTQKRGRLALFFAILQGVCWLINLSSFVLTLTPTILIVNLLFFILFFALALALGWKIKKRNDAAKWAVILAFGYLVLNIAVSVVGTIIGVVALI